jgi:hypothetical protein
LGQKQAGEQNMAKTFICAICGEEVSKPKSYSIGDNKRACRTHEEAQSQAAEAQKQLEEQHAKGRSRPKRKPPLEETMDLSPRCFCCGEKGMRQDEFFLRILILGEQYKLTYGKPLNPFDIEECKKAYSPLKGQRCLLFVNYKPWMKKKLARYSDAAEMLGFFVACPACVSKHKFKTQMEEKEIKLEYLEMHSILYEGIIRPELQKYAQKELEGKN